MIAAMETQVDVNAQDFGLSLRDVMRCLVGGVSVITAGVGDDRTGLTATSVTSLSVEPPTMLFCVNRNASAWPVIRRHRHFCVNILAERHRAVADRFAGRGGAKGVERYAGARWVTLATGALALEDALAAIDCEVEETIERHSHAIVIGAAKTLRVGDGDALAHQHGRYGTYRSTARQLNTLVSPREL
jgi:3-hydroxy-9,10-secoandrosta-1,3,5(10)-triene-9,17-dione monooxygenase reductase component